MRRSQGLATRLGVVIFGLSGAIAAPTPADDWEPTESPLMTRWASDLSPETVHQEYPRPQITQYRWQNFNGLWEYAISP